MCKVKYAVCVKKNMPLKLNCGMSTTHKSIFMMIVMWHNTVDNIKNIGKINLTFNRYHSVGAHDAKVIFCRSQSEGVARTRNTKFPSGGCPRSVVSRKRVFRSTRSCTGQIRDAASLSIRGYIGCLRSSVIRLFTGHFLPGIEAIQRKWNSRSFAKVAGAKRCPQAFAGTDSLHGKGAGPRSRSSARDACRAHQDPLQHLGSSTQYRKGTCPASKKTTQIKTLYPCNGEVARRYEHLRCQAIKRVPPKAELGLFVHRGMAVWIKTWASDTPARVKPIAGVPVRCRSFSEPDIVMIIAGMVLSCTKGVEDDS
jgi:hypothetical protein